MAENPSSIDCGTAADSGDRSDNTRRLMTLNGKRTLADSSCQDNTDLSETEVSATAPHPPSIKKSKTVMNGIEHSSDLPPNQAPSLHNGIGKQGNDSQNGANLPSVPSAASSFQISNGADVVHSNVNTSLQSNKNMTSNSNPTPRNDIKREHSTKDSVERLKPGGDVKARVTVKQEVLDGKKEAEPEIITLSDSEDEFQEVLMQAMSLTSSEHTRCKLLKLYQDQLRAEESKLILLRKLKRSLAHIEKQNSTTAIHSNSKHMSSTEMRAQGYTTASGSSSSSTQRSSSGGNIPPPLKRGHHSSSPHHGLPNQHSSHHKISSSNHHQSMHSVDRHKHSHQSNGQQSSGGPPPLVNMAKSSPQTANSNASYRDYQVTQTKKAATPAQPPPPPQPTKEQKLAAAKIALRKQLEQALQQVPAPKPPPPEVNFLPSLSSGEFVYLIGMEEVVTQLLSTDQRDVKFVFNPFSCVQCDTDFTPVWKRDKPGSKSVICERCITTNQKRVLKQEHTAKLKAVFHKATQKEQELERRIAAGSPLSDMPGIAMVAARQQKSHVPPAAAVAAAAAAAASAVGTPSMPQLTPQHNQQGASSASPNSISSSQQHLTPQQLQQQLMLSQQAEQMRQMLAAQMSLPYSLYGVTNKQAADLHRQYLLDMINQNRSSWKT